jgi:hypothetical protein
MAFIYKRKSRRPKIEPCGTPRLTLVENYELSLISCIVPSTTVCM